MTKRRGLVCPYKSTNKNKCTHKDAGDHCVFNSPMNCPIFIQWLDKVDISNKSQPEASDSLTAP